MLKRVKSKWQTSAGKASKWMCALSLCDKKRYIWIVLSLNLLPQYI